MLFAHLVQAPNPILRTPGREVEVFDEELEKFAEGMVRWMDGLDGVGLAAPQISFCRRIAVVRIDEKRVLPLVNPRIAEMSDEKETLEEGCLSLPGLPVEVERSEAVRVLAQDLSGEEMDLELEGRAARIVQHEIDHLNGKLILDYLWS